MSHYYFLYKDVSCRWNNAVNPVFIAKHTHCRAIPKEIVNGFGYESVADFIFDLNENKNQKLSSIIFEWNLV